MKFLSEYEVWQRCITFRSHIHEAIYVIYTFVSGGRQPPNSGRCWPCTTYIPTHPTGGVSYTLHSNLFGGWQCFLGGDFNYVVFSIQEIWLASRMSESKPAVLIWAWPHNWCTKYVFYSVCTCICVYIHTYGYIYRLYIIYIYIHVSVSRVPTPPMAWSPALNLHSYILPICTECIISPTYIIFPFHGLAGSEVLDTTLDLNLESGVGNAGPYIHNTTTQHITCTHIRIHTYTIH